MILAFPSILIAEASIAAIVPIPGYQKLGREGILPSSINLMILLTLYYISLFSGVQAVYLGSNSGFFSKSED